MNMFRMILFFQAKIHFVNLKGTLKDKIPDLARHMASTINEFEHGRRNTLLKREVLGPTV